MEQTKAKVLRLVYMNTGLLPPDIGTKEDFDGPEFERKRGAVMGTQNP